MLRSCRLGNAEAYRTNISYKKNDTDNYRYNIFKSISADIIGGPILSDIPTHKLKLQVGSCGQIAVTGSGKKVSFKGFCKIAPMVHGELRWSHITKHLGDHFGCLQGGGEWEVMCSKFNSSAICLWRRPFIAPNDFNTVVTAWTYVWLRSRLSGSNFPHFLTVYL